MSSHELDVQYASQGRSKQLTRQVDGANDEESLENLLQAVDWMKRQVNEYLTVVVEEEKSASSKGKTEPVGTTGEEVEEKRTDGEEMKNEKGNEEERERKRLKGGQ